MLRAPFFFFLLLLDQTLRSEQEWSRTTDYIDLSAFPAVFQKAPPPKPAYMVDDSNLKKGLAPVHGKHSLEY